MILPQSRKIAPCAFLSSPVYGLEALRRDMHGIGQAEGTPVYVDEIDTPRDLSSHDPLETVDDLLATIQKSRQLICLFGPPRHGSRILFGTRQTHVSYWEIELFFAALSGTPTSVLVLDGFSPDPKLEAFLGILKFALPREKWIRVPNEAAAADWLRLQLRPRKGTEFRKSFARLKGYLGSLIQQLFLNREETLMFLDGILHDPNVDPDIDLIKSVLNETGPIRDEKKRLCRLWLAGRELMGARVEDRKNSDFLPLWSRFFHDWASAGAWYGLHGHIHMGCLAALRGAAWVASVAKDTQSERNVQYFEPEVLAYPGGALASARYSISGKMTKWSLRKRLLIQARADVDRSLAEGVEDETNLIAIRGSIKRRMFHFSEAVSDYEEVVKQREMSGASDSQLGEALSELGFGYVLQGRLLKGKDLLTRGVNLIEPSPRRLGFYIRAKKKLAIACMATGAWRSATQHWTEARDWAERFNVLDQL